MLTWLADELRSAGLTVREYPGWQTRGRPTGAYAPRAVIVHHDASAVGPSNYEPQFIAVTGRPAEGIPAPLAQCWVAKDGTWWVLAAGRCNHAGLGSGWGVIRPNDGNADAVGVEWDHTTGEDVTDVEYHSLLTGVRAIAKRLGASIDTGVCGHKEYAPGRKTDPDIDMDRFRADLKATQEDDLTPDQAQKLDAIYQGMFNGSHTADRDYPALLAIESETQRRVTVAAAQVGALQATVTALAKNGNLTAAQISQAAQAGAENALKVLGEKLSGA